jgi:predicted MPP superfamily phosphohydrolase
MSDLWPLLVVLVVLAAWAGHAYVWTAGLNNLYGRRLPKRLLKPWRFVTGAVIVAFPLLLATGFEPVDDAGTRYAARGPWGNVVLAYAAVCLLFGAIVFPAVTVYRLLRKPPAAIVAERTETLDVWGELGAAVVGEGKWAWAGRLPLNGIFRVDFTDLTLAVPNLPPAWDGLTILLLSDLHFHGTPGRPFFDRVFDRITAAPPPDLVCLAGDYVDSDAHHAWVGALLGRLHATQGKFAVLGNHDEHHHPEKLRDELAAAGYRVLGNGWEEVDVRGEPCLVVGHEGPWFGPPPDLSAAPAGPFRLCVSHSPDSFYWGRQRGINLMLCGHVHGGQIRVPVVGSIFVPSVYGRRFDTGVFEAGGTVMVVGRGLSGKEPLRFRCNPQVIRMTLTARPPAA